MYCVALLASLVSTQQTASFEQTVSPRVIINVMWKHQTYILDELDVYTLK